MGQLKDLLVSGPSRFIGKLFANEAQLTTLNIPTTSGGTTYGPGTNNQILTSNGTTVYWANGFSGNASTADKLKTARTIAISGGATGTATSFDGSGNITIPVTALDVSKVNAGTLAIAHGGTGATTAANARTNLGLGSIATETATNYFKWQTTTTGLDSIYDFGVYVNMNNAAGSSMTGGNYFSVLSIPYRKASGNTKADWGFQIGNTTSNDSRLWYRTSGDNVWGDWQTIAHATQSTSNIGSATQPVYMTSAGVITAGTALKDLAYIAKPSSNQTTTFLRGDGTWQAANNYSLPLAANGTRGGVQIGYTQSGKNYPVQLSSEKMYVNVPWTDTTYSNFVKSGSTAAAGLVPSPGTTAGVERYLNEDGTWEKVYESFLSWGGKNFSASYGPIDAAMVDPLGANRFAFLKAAGLTIEYSTDGGSNWTDYGATNAQKVGLFSNGYGFHLGKHTSNGSSTVNDQLRVTIDTGTAQIYTVLNKIVIYMSTNGNTVQVKIEKALQSTPTTYSTHLDWTGISGWSGWNILNINDITTYGNTAGSQYGRIRFTFKQSAVNSGSNPAAVISRIMGFGGMGWTIPSNMARDGHLYSYDADQNATFPAKVTATSFSGNLTGNVTGNADTATKFASSHSVTLTGDVTGSASSQAGWSVATTLANSGVTAASYGPSANASPSHGGTFSVPYLTVDAKGRVTAASTKTITLPASGNTDTLVTQTNTTSDASYRLLLSENANDTTETKTAKKSTKLQFNPSSGKLTLSGGAHINQAYTGTATAAANNSGTYTPAKWTFNLGFNPVTGDTIIIKVPGAGHDYGVFLSTDNGANYHPIRVWASNGRLSTHYAAGSYIELTYDSTQVTNDVFAAGGATARSNITGSWNVVSYYDSNTTRVWNLYKGYGNYTANNAIKRYQILFQGLRPNEKKLIALYETDNNTATGKTLLTSTEFDPLGEIFYYNSTGAYATGNTIDAGRLDWTALADLRFTFNITNDTSVAATTAFRGTAPNPLYLRVTINSATGGAKVDTNQPLTTTLPTTADGKYYIYLGNVYDWYRVYLDRDHPVYFHNGTKLIEYKGSVGVNHLDLRGSTTATMTAASTNPKITFSENGAQPVYLIYSDYDNYRAPAGLKIIGGTSATPAWLEVEGSYYATGASTGQSYYILGNGVEYGRWWLNTIGKAGTATTYTNPDNSSQTITGYTGNVTGNIYLSIGNNKAVGSNGSSYASPGTAGTANNAQGYLRLYGSGTTYGEMTGYGNYIYPTNGIAFPENKVALNFRPGSSSYYTHFSHQTSGNEALVMATQNAVTSFIFVNGESLSNIASDRWTKLTGASGAGNAPGLQIKNNCVSIGKLIPNNTTPTYKLEVNGTSYLNGDTTITGNILFQNTNQIIWDEGTYRQRIHLTDDSTADTAVFTFQQSANAGSSWSDLLIIKDNGTSIMTGGLEIRGHIAGDSGTTGNGLYSGGGYHNAYNNIILHGDNTSGSSGIAFVSDKVSNGVTIANVNQPSDRAFIQYHACGITTATAEGTAPTLATSGEAGRLVIGVGNDATDQVWLQAPSHTDLIHQIGASSYVIPDTGNTTGTVGSTTTPVYVNAGVVTSLAGQTLANNISGSAASATKATQDGNGNNIVSTYLNKTTDGTMQGNLTMASGKKFIGNLQGNADTATTATTATKATQDGNGANIANTYLKKSGGDMTGTLKLKGLKGTASTDYGETLPTSPTEGQIFFQLSSEQYELPAGGATGTLLMKASASNYDVQWTPAAVYVSGSVLYGAAWNDYAEFRSTTGKIEPGRVVIENGDDTLSLSTERLQGGAEIVSDTFGFAIGQTERCNTPIAASGRVLAYPNEPRDTYKPGQPVCSGPNGTVSQMTDEEARNYPWLIIGTVSAIPDYETWGEDNIEVKGRIWVRIR